MSKEYIERPSLIGKLTSSETQSAMREMDGSQAYSFFLAMVNSETAANVVEVVSGYHAGDICIYGFGAENKSRAIVEIVRILNDERGVAEVKFHKVFVDDTGNGFFNYLLKTGNTMNASFKYLKNITPRLDGGADNGDKENL